MKSSLRLIAGVFVGGLLAFPLGLMMRSEKVDLNTAASSDLLRCFLKFAGTTLAKKLNQEVPIHRSGFATIRFGTDGLAPIFHDVPTSTRLNDRLPSMVSKDPIRSIGREYGGLLDRNSNFAVSPRIRTTPAWTITPDPRTPTTEISPLLSPLVRMYSSSE